MWSGACRVERRGYDINGKFVFDGYLWMYGTGLAWLTRLTTKVNERPYLFNLLKCWLPLWSFCTRHKQSGTWRRFKQNPEQPMFKGRLISRDRRSKLKSLTKLAKNLLIVNRCGQLLFRLRWPDLGAAWGSVCARTRGIRLMLLLTKWSNVHKKANPTNFEDLSWSLGQSKDKGFNTIDK